MGIETTSFREVPPPKNTVKKEAFMAATRRALGATTLITMTTLLLLLAPLGEAEAQGPTQTQEAQIVCVSTQPESLPDQIIHIGRFSSSAHGYDAALLGISPITDVFTPGNEWNNLLLDSLNWIRGEMRGDTAEYINSIVIGVGGEDADEAVHNRNGSTATTPFVLVCTDEGGRTILNSNHIVFTDSIYPQLVVEEVVQGGILNQTVLPRFNTGELQQYGIGTPDQLVYQFESGTLRYYIEVLQHALLELFHEGWHGTVSSGYTYLVDTPDAGASYSEFTTGMGAIGRLNQMLEPYMHWGYEDWELLYYLITDGERIDRQLSARFGRNISAMHLVGGRKGENSDVNPRYTSADLLFMVPAPTATQLIPTETATRTATVMSTASETPTSTSTSTATNTGFPTVSATLNPTMTATPTQHVTVSAIPATMLPTVEINQVEEKDKAETGNEIELLLLALCSGAAVTAGMGYGISRALRKRRRTKEDQELLRQLRDAAKRKIYP
ncbi:MAG: hypothetical protein ACE5DX_00615 [Candidatus Dojkabacteria bacterium]